MEKEQPVSVTSLSPFSCIESKWLTKIFGFFLKNYDFKVFVKYGKLDLVFPFETLHFEIPKV